MKNLLAILLLSLTLAACGTPADLKYNEAVTPVFLSNVQRIDQDMERLIGGEFDAGHGVATVPSAEGPEQRIAALEHDLNQVQQLRHSDAASQFASGLSRYYELQISYYRQLQHYAGTRDKARQEAMVQDLYQAYQVLKAEPEAILAAQRQFLERSRTPG